MSELCKSCDGKGGGHPLFPGDVPLVEMWICAECCGWGFYPIHPHDRLAGRMLFRARQDLERMRREQAEA